MNHGLLKKSISVIFLGLFFGFGQFSLSAPAYADLSEQRICSGCASSVEDKTRCGCKNTDATPPRKTIDANAATFIYDPIKQAWLPNPDGNLIARMANPPEWQYAASSIGPSANLTAVLEETSDCEKSKDEAKCKLDIEAVLNNTVPPEPELRGGMSDAPAAVLEPRASTPKAIVPVLEPRADAADRTGIMEIGARLLQESKRLLGLVFDVIRIREASAEELAPKNQVLNDVSPIDPSIFDKRTKVAQTTLTWRAVNTADTGPTAVTAIFSPSTSNQPLFTATMRRCEQKDTPQCSNAPGDCDLVSTAVLDPDHNVGGMQNYCCAWNSGTQSRLCLVKTTAAQEEQAAQQAAQSMQSITGPEGINPNQSGEDTAGKAAKRTVAVIQSNTVAGALSRHSQTLSSLAGGPTGTVAALAATALRGNQGRVGAMNSGNLAAMSEAGKAAQIFRNALSPRGACYFCGRTNPRGSARFAAENDRDDSGSPYKRAYAQSSPQARFDELFRWTGYFVCRNTDGPFTTEFVGKVCGAVGDLNLNEKEIKKGAFINPAYAATNGQGRDGPSNDAICKGRAGVESAGREQQELLGTRPVRGMIQVAQRGDTRAPEAMCLNDAVNANVKLRGDALDANTNPEDQSAAGTWEVNRGILANDFSSRAGTALAETYLGRHAQYNGQQQSQNGGPIKDALAQGACSGGGPGEQARCQDMVRLNQPLTQVIQGYGPGSNEGIPPDQEVAGAQNLQTRSPALVAKVACHVRITDKARRQFVRGGETLERPWIASRGPDGEACSQDESGGGASGSQVAENPAGKIYAMLGDYLLQNPIKLHKDWYKPEYLAWATGWKYREIVYRAAYVDRWRIQHDRPTTMTLAEWNNYFDVMIGDEDDKKLIALLKEKARRDEPVVAQNTTSGGVTLTAAQSGGAPVQATLNINGTMIPVTINVAAIQSQQVKIQEPETVTLPFIPLPISKKTEQADEPVRQVPLPDEATATPLVSKPQAVLSESIDTLRQNIRYVVAQSSEAIQSLLTRAVQ